MSRYIDAEAFKRRILSYGIVHEGDRIPIPFYKRYFAEAYVAILRWVCEEVDDTPAADVVPRWIPVTERLPETTDPVNITWVNRKPSRYNEHIKDKPFVATGHYCNGWWYWFSAVCEDYLNEYGDCEMDRIDSAVEVIAWMPLPTPYKGGEEE